MLMRNEYYFLSNMFPCEIAYNGHTYKSVESAFQAQKDLSCITEFEGLDGIEAKRLGRSVKLRSDWDAVKLDIMEELLKIKFSSPELAEKLKSVKEPIVEDNTWYDTYWGVCNGKGQNNLGKLLTKIRDDLLEKGVKNENIIRKENIMKVKFEGRCIASYTGVIDVPDSIGKDGRALEEYISSHLDEVSEHINMEYSSDMPYREDNVRCINEIEEKETDYER